MGIRCRIRGGISARPAGCADETLHQFALLKKRARMTRVATRRYACRSGRRAGRACTAAGPQLAKADAASAVHPGEPTETSLSRYPPAPSPGRARVKHMAHKNRNHLKLSSVWDENPRLAP